jgi:hypothetical protein
MISLLKDFPLQLRCSGIFEVPLKSRLTVGL